MRPTSSPITVAIKGEARSNDEKFISAIVAGYRKAFEKAGTMVKDAGGEAAEVKFSAKPSYPPFNMADTEAGSQARQAGGGVDRPEADDPCSPMEAWMPTGWSSMAYRP